METFGLMLGLAFCICGTWGAKEIEISRPDIGRTRHWKQLTLEASDFTDPEKEELEERQNDLRSEIRAANMKYMEWDEDLANKAKLVANECLSVKKNAADPVNIYMGPSKDAQSVIDTWNKNAGANCEKPEDLCTYQQMMVPDSGKFGCAWKNCARANSSLKYLVVCHYDIKFDKDKHAITPGIPCSECSEKEPECYKNLCMSKDLCAEKFQDDCGSTKRKNDAMELFLKQDDAAPAADTTPDAGAAPPAGGGSDATTVSQEEAKSGSPNHSFLAISTTIAGMSVWLVNINVLSG